MLKTHFNNLNLGLGFATILMFKSVAKSGLTSLLHVSQTEGLYRDECPEKMQRNINEM